VNGYTGTQDANLFSVQPNTVQGGGTQATFSIDNQDGGGVRQAAMRFDNLFGPGANQIPLGSVINSATLTITAVDETSADANLGPYRLLTDWGQTTATWNTFSANGIGGVQPDGVDAVPLLESILNPTAGTGPRDFIVTEAVRAWAGGAPNFGWAIINYSGNGWDIATSENGAVASRPLLTVDFTAPSGPGAFRFSQSAYGVVEGRALTVTVQRVGGTAGAVSVQYAATAGTAGAADFTPVSGTLNFAAGEVFKTFTVTTLDDALLEGAETINLALSSPTGGATIGLAAATLTIQDQDVLLSEVLASPPAGDGFDYVELAGAPGLALTNVYFVAFEGDSGENLGIADFVANLSAASLGSAGMLVIKAAAGGYAIPAGAAQ
jgi:hypothetical protein